MNLKRLLFLSLLLLFAFLGDGCKKISKSWVVGELYVYDALSGEPLQVHVNMEYYQNPLLGEVQSQSQLLGKTGADGRLNFEFRTARRNGGHKLAIYHPQEYGSLIPIPRYTRKSVSQSGTNDISIGLTPYYPFHVNAVNVNCAAPNDSVWITFTYGSEWYETRTLEAYGCADTAYERPYFPNVTENSSYAEVTFNITTKKSGVLNSYNTSYNLIPANKVEILIEY